MVPLELCLSYDGCAPAVAGPHLFHATTHYPDSHSLPDTLSQVSMLRKYSEAIRGNLTKIMRLKIVALVTVEVHARDVIDKLYKLGCMDVTAFDWLSQLRLYWDKKLSDLLSIFLM
eukprot:g25562.t1